MKAVCTTLGCCAAAAAPTAGAELPLALEVPLLALVLWFVSASPFASWACAWVWWVGVRCWRSALEAVRLGGPMAEVEDAGMMSIGSRGGASEELEEGRMGIDLCMFGLESPENGLRRASATDAIEWDAAGKDDSNVEVLGC